VAGEDGAAVRYPETQGLSGSTGARLDTGVDLQVCWVAKVEVSK